MTEPATLASPRLRALASALAAGTPGALTTFWDEVTATGAPLVERDEQDPATCLVTVLWRASTPVTNVVHVEWYSPGDLPDKRLAPLPGSNVWFRTLRFRSDVRWVYRLLPDDTLRPLRGDPDFDARFARMQRDPLNPRRILPARLATGAEPEWGDASVVVLPDAAPLPGFEVPADVPHGAVEEHTIASAGLGQDRRVWIHVTPGVAEAGAPPARLLLQFDGDRCLDVFDLPWLLDGLAATGTIPPLVTVMIDTPDRGVDLPCNDAFAAFLADELIPYVRQRYRLAAGPAAVIAAGQSYGGLAAAWAALRRPDAIGNALSQSGSFWWMPGVEKVPQSPPLGEAPGYAWLPGQVAAWPAVPVRFYLGAGVLEAGNSGVEPSLLATNRHLRDVLRAKRYDVTYEEYAGGHDYHIWRGTYPNGLRALLG